MSGVSETIFFLHIPKNSGTTLNQIVRANYRSIFKVSWDNANDRSSAGILRGANPDVFAGFEMVSGHYPYGLHRALPAGQPYRYITMLRDPFKRTLSAYNYLRSDSKYIKKHPEAHGYVNALSLGEYCSREHELLPNSVYNDNGQVRYLSGVGDSKPFGTVDERDLEFAKQNLAAMEFGLTEEFDRSMLYLQKRLAWKSVAYTRQKIGSVRGGAQQRHSPDDIAAVGRCNQLDNQLYEFAQALFAERASQVSEQELQAYRKRLARYQAFETPRRLIRRLGGILRLR